MLGTDKGPLASCSDQRTEHSRPGGQPWGGWGDVLVVGANKALTREFLISGSVQGMLPSVPHWEPAWLRQPPGCPGWPQGSLQRWSPPGSPTGLFLPHLPAAAVGERRVGHRVSPGGPAHPHGAGARWQAGHCLRSCCTHHLLVLPA